MKKIVIASGNEGKINDFKSIFKEFEVIGIKTLLDDFEPVEDGQSFKENALIKAIEGAKRTNLPVVSDDSGLSVEALEGKPGIKSARFAGEHATDDENNKKLLDLLEGKENRSAYFTSVIAVAFPDGTTSTYEGAVFGEILEAPVGNNGFGYDPLFQTLDGIKFGEISTDEKSEISHRKNAIDKLLKDEELFKKLQK
ncbi:MAG TPA: RdgB/HAM1 family non-canonical purine NTP pyrophosphatase [Candidatus Nosocomiicoccus stercorigallinarum]|nr:RdgB/HAM1 family non-canonical purine NTP pyrophosphatase [Candidatus Nosocomiicoccus stercorigallinarum]